MGLGRVAALGAACALLPVLGVAQPATADSQACPDASLTPSADNEQQAAASVLCLINAQRASSGLPALSWNAQLGSAAQQMAGRMVGEQFYSHQTPDGQTLATRVGATGYVPTTGDWQVGENLGWGDYTFATPAAIVDAWMASAEHRANVLDPTFREVGVGMVPGSPFSTPSGGATYVADFGFTQPATKSEQFAVGSTRSLQIARERKVRHLRRACWQRRGEFRKMVRAKRLARRTGAHRTCQRRRPRAATTASSARTCCAR